APVACDHSAAIPLTCGVAMLVPEMIRYRVGVSHDEYTSTPGPAMSTWPPTTALLRAEKFPIRSWESRAATAMIDGLFAGTPTNPKLPWARSALLQAAAMTRLPAANARRPAASYAWLTGRRSAPRDMEMTRQRFAIAQSMPARICPSVPRP